MASAMKAISLYAMLSRNLLVNGVGSRMSWHGAVEGSVKDCHMAEVWKQLHAGSHTGQIGRHVERGLGQNSIDF